MHSQPNLKYSILTFVSGCSITDTCIAPDRLLREGPLPILSSLSDLSLASDSVVYTHAIRVAEAWPIFGIASGCSITDTCIAPDRLLREGPLPILSSLSDLPLASDSRACACYPGSRGVTNFWNCFSLPRSDLEPSEGPMPTEGLSYDC